MASRKPKPDFDFHGKPKTNNGLVDIAATTLSAIDAGSFELEGVTYDLRAATACAKDQATFYADDAPELVNWQTRPSVDSKGFADSAITVPEAEAETRTDIRIILASTLETARNLYNEILSLSSSETSPSQLQIGILNFASAKNPGGGFMRGAQAQEESLARSSTLYPPLLTPSSQSFYASHKRDPKRGFYSHAMIYVPRTLFFRDDSGLWMRPIFANVLVSAAVNAGVVRRELGTSDATENQIAKVMLERMARILQLFESRGSKDIVLGSFGTGVFRNSVPTVASLWARLLVAKDARFRNSFDRVVFAIKDEKTYVLFREAFERAK